MTVAKALEVWSAQALCDLGIFLSLFSFLLEAARPNIERHLGGLSVRMSADFARTAYLALREGSLALAVAIGLFHLNLDLMADIKIGLPFVPMATVVLLAALLVKLSGTPLRADRRRRLTEGLVATGALLNLLGFVLVMEGPGAEYGLSPDSPLMHLVSWRSNANPRLAMACFVGAFALIVLEIAVVLVAVARRAPSPIESGSKFTQKGPCDSTHTPSGPLRRSEPVDEGSST